MANAVPPYRMNLVVGVVVALATVVGFVCWAVLAAPVSLGADPTIFRRIGFPLPALAAALSLWFLVRPHGMRCATAALVVFGATMAAMVLALVLVPSVTLVVTAVTAGVVAAFARRFVVSSAPLSHRPEE